MMNGFKNGCWYNTVKHVVYTSKVLTDSSKDLNFCYKPCSTEKPKASNIRLESICGELYPFMKHLPVRDEQSDSFPIIDYKPLLV